jgi:hypothetical protein
MGADLITDYLDALRARLRSRRDADDLVAEVDDHLRAHVDALVRDGRDPEDAARLALETFGDPDIVSRAYLTTSAGKLAVPTVSTRVAGSLARLSAVLWVCLPAVWAVGALVAGSVDEPPADYVAYFIGVFVLAGASALMCAVAFAIRVRHGGSIGLLGLAGLAALILGAVSGLVVAWAVPVWMTLLGLGTGLVAVSILRRPIAPRLPAVLLGIALPAGAIAFVIVRALELGSPDEYGDYPAATFAALTVGCVLNAAAMFATSRWLAREEPFVAVDPALVPTI